MGTTARVKVVVGWVLAVLLAVAFLISGSMKLRGDEQMAEHFRNWGYPDWFMTVVGAAEVAGAALLLISRFSRFAVFGLAVIMVGAVITHITHQETAQAVPALVLLFLLGIAAVVRWPRTLRQRWRAVGIL
jgi:uncharacterized membrane protein YphA (DoxX/SURF4 family)